MIVSIVIIFLGMIFYFYSAFGFNFEGMIFAVIIGLVAVGFFMSKLFNWIF